MKIISLVFNGAGSILIENCAKLYCEVWKESPWNEDFWVASEVLKDISRELSKRNAVGLLAIDDQDDVIGFTWGYSVSEADMRKISGGNDFSHIVNVNGGAFYIDELGVDSGNRGVGIGMALSQRLIVEVEKRGVSSIFLRTDEKAVAAKALYQKLGFRELPVRDKKYHGRTYWVKEI